MSGVADVDLFVVIGSFDLVGILAADVVGCGLVMNVIGSGRVGVLPLLILRIVNGDVFVSCGILFVLLSVL